MKKINLKPRFLEFAPQTPLNEKLHGKYYQHWIWCEASNHKPVGECRCGQGLKKQIKSLDEVPPLWKFINDWKKELDKRYGT